MRAQGGCLATCSFGQCGCLCLLHSVHRIEAQTATRRIEETLGMKMAKDDAGMTDARWQTLKADIRGSIGENNYKTWIDPVGLSHIEDGVAVMTTRTERSAFMARLTSSQAL